MLAVGLCFSATLTARAQATPTAITEFPVDVGHSSNLDSLLAGPEGNIWFTDHWWPEGSYHALIGRMDSAGNVEEFDEGLNMYSSPRDLTAGPDGNIWFADAGSALGGAGLGKIAPSGTITEYRGGLAGSRPDAIAFGSDGNLWYTAYGNRAVGFATLNGEITDFELPGRPWDLVAGPDGNIWFTYGGNGTAPAIGRIKHSAGGTTIITLFSAGLNAGSQPYKIISSQNGYLWFLDPSDTNPAIGRIATTGQIEEFSTGLSPKTSLWDLAAGPEGNVWFTDPEARTVGRVSPAGQITEFGNEINSTHEPRYITAGPDGNMWFTDYERIGRISPYGLITTLHEGLNPASFPIEITSGSGGYLWFRSTTSNFSNAIGRITPGDDTPPPPQPVEALQLPSKVGRLVLRSKKVRVSYAARGHLRFTCQSSTTCTGQLHLYVERRAGAAGTAISLASFSIAAGDSSRVVFKLNPMGRRLLRANRHMQAHLYFSSNSVPVAGPTTFLLIQLSGHRTRP